MSVGYSRYPQNAILGLFCNTVAFSGLWGSVFRDGGESGQVCGVMVQKSGCFFGEVDIGHEQTPYRGIANLTACVEQRPCLRWLIRGVMWHDLR